MIASLKGSLDSRGEDWAVIDVRGVGYLVQASATSLAAMGRIGDDVHLWIETRWREDGVQLYGFSERLEQQLFRLLTGIQGVGAKMALGVLSAFGAGRLTAILASKDEATLRAAPGVGTRLAQRLCAELADRLPAQTRLEASPASGVRSDALSALLNLGYRRSEASRALDAALARLGSDARLEALIAESLKAAGS